MEQKGSRGHSGKKEMSMEDNEETNLYTAADKNPLKYPNILKTVQISLVSFQFCTRDKPPKGNTIPHSN